MRPYCPRGGARVVPGTSKPFALTLSSSIVRHKLIIKKKEIVMWIKPSCFVFFAAASPQERTSVSGPQPVRSPAVPLVPCKELGVGVWLPNSAAGAARQGWSHRWQWGMSGSHLQVPVVVALLCRRVHGQLAEGTRSPMAEHTLICPENGL